MSKNQLKEELVKKILLIDDEDLTLLFLKKVLLEEGYDVTVASDGESGLAKFKEDPADLVITDMVMPIKDGLSMILELRELDEKVPVVAISGGGAIAKERYLAVAATLDNVHTLAKPMKMVEFRRLIRDLLY